MGLGVHGRIRDHEERGKSIVFGRGCRPGASAQANSDKNSISRNAPKDVLYRITACSVQCKVVRYAPGRIDHPLSMLGMTHRSGKYERVPHGWLIYI